MASYWAASIFDFFTAFCQTWYKVLANRLFVVCIILVAYIWHNIKPWLRLNEESIIYWGIFIEPRPIYNGMLIILYMHIGPYNWTTAEIKFQRHYSVREYWTAAAFVASIHQSVRYDIEQVSLYVELINLNGFILSRVYIWIFFSISSDLI